MIKYKTPLFKENMELILQIINSCEGKDDFTVKIANIAALFEISKKQLESIVKDSDNKGPINLIKQLFDEHGIKYKTSLFETWFKIRDLRNMYPIHSRYDPVQFSNLLEFFNTQLSSPPNYSELWENILKQFSESLLELLDILNQQLREER